MREIKFRGRHVEYHDEIYYGFYEMDARGNHFIIDSNNIMHIVEPESVAQFVGHDSNGNEVYEGDVLTDSQGNTYIAKFDSVVERQSNRTPAFRRAPFDFTKEFIELTVEAAS